MALDAISVQCLRHIGEVTRGIGKLATRMAAMAEGAGDALPVNLILFPQSIRSGMATPALRGTVGRVADQDEYEIDTEEYPCHRDPDQPCFL